MRLEQLLTEILELAPAYQAYIRPDAAAHDLRFRPPANTELFQLASSHAPFYVGLLHEKLAQVHPKAGKIYWTTTAWRTLTWSPLFLSVLAVHCVGKGLCLDGFGFWVTHESIEGNAFDDHPVFSGGEEERISYAGRQIGQVFRAVHHACVQRFPFNIKLAQKLYTDSIAESLILQNDHFPQCNPDRRRLTQAEVEARLAKWLKAADLPVVPGTLQLPNGKCGLNRQACCQYYRVEGGEECADCTRIPMDQRIVLMCEETS